MMNETLGIYLPDCVLDFTEGKRAVVVGDKVDVTDKRKSMRKVFEFASLDWSTDSSRRNEHVHRRTAQRIRSKSYDVVFVLTNCTSHSAIEIIKPAARESCTYFINVNNGWTPTHFSMAIEEQVCRDIERQAKSSGQVIASGGGGRPVNY